MTSPTSVDSLAPAEPGAQAHTGHGHGHGVADGRSGRVWTWGAWSLVVLAGLTMLPLPFTGDQALYLQYGQRLVDGAVLYRDVWDVKQPAIFWFHGLPAAVLGASAVVAHLVVVAWWLGGAALAQRSWRSRLDHPVARAAVPLLTAGTLLATVRPIDIGQVEHLVGLPLLASWWLVRQPDPGHGRGRATLVAAGATAAVVGLFKHLYLAVAVALLLLALVRLARRSGAATAVRAVAWWALGALVVVAPFAAQVVATGQTGRVWWTFVQATGEMRALDPPPLSRLVRSTARAVVMTLPLLVLAVVGRRRAWRAANRPGTVDMLAWVGVGAVTLASQLWWPYQQLLVFVPLGLLAAHGVDELAERWADPARRRRAIAVAALVGVTAVAAAAPLAVRASLLARHGLALTAAGRADLRREAEPAERAAVATRAFLEGADARPGTVLLLGNPVHLLGTGRDQAGAVHGWSPEFSTPDLWAETVEAVADSDVAYVAIDEVSQGFVDDRAPELNTLLRRDFRRIDAAPGSGLTWWERATP